MLAMEGRIDAAHTTSDSGRLPPALFNASSALLRERGETPPPVLDDDQAAF